MRRDSEIVELLRAIRQELAITRAPRSGPITIAVACGILACGKSRLHGLIREGIVKRWPKKGLGKEALLDAASIWRLFEAPAPVKSSERRSSDASAEAEQVLKLKID